MEAPRHGVTLPVDPLPPPAGQRGAGEHRATWSARRTRSRAILPLGSGRLRARPRLRLVLGTVFALSLGAVLPVLHARHTRRVAIDPLVQELANVQAHGEVLTRLPAYRTPAVLHELIAGHRLRGVTATALIWLAAAAGLTYVWRRIT